MPEREVLRQYQALPLAAKVNMSLARIREWYEYWDGSVCISFSGGKDSTVLAHLVHEYYPDVPLVFSNTGLEYPEIQQFARKMGATFVYPKMRFSEVISQYGYPIISKETAQAIYYARLIHNLGGGHATSDKKREELNGRRFVSGVRECYRRRADLQGTRNNFDVQLWQSDPDTIGNRTWADWRRKALLGAEQFSKGKSLFNKEKWLPLAEQTQFMISDYCCGVMKKSPMNIYLRKNKVHPFIGTLTDESKLREWAWIMHGCNAYEGSKKTSQPLSFWKENDILEYIKTEGIEIAPIYGEIIAVDKYGYEYEPIPGIECQYKTTGCNRTGCIYCAFGAHLEKGETRFQRLARTHPKQYEYCMKGGQWVDNPKYDPTAPKMDGDWQNWNPKKIWVPSKEGLGMKKVFDDCNAIYGKDFIRYE